MKKFLLTLLLSFLLNPLFAQETKVHDYITIIATAHANGFQITWADGTLENYKIEEKRKFGDFSPIVRLIQEQEAKGFELFSTSTGSGGNTGLHTLFILRKPKE